MSDLEAEETALAILEQDKYDLSFLAQAKALTIFLIPSNLKITGGIISIFSLCSNFRNLDKQRLYLLATLPGKYTYAKNTFFENEEQIYRFEQIIRHGSNIIDLCIHIPEICLSGFFRNLNSGQINFLKSKNLQLNILNQNLELMPSPYFVQKLRGLTENITQSVAHKRYCTQEVCNKWNIPTHWLFFKRKHPTQKILPFKEKEKIIVVSPDENPHRTEILGKISHELPEFKFFVVNNIPYEDYLTITGRALFSLTFGEGMDGYFGRAYALNGIGFAVYNSTFFPDNSWLGLETVFASYEDMAENLVNKIKEFCNNGDKFELTNKMIKEKIQAGYTSNDFIDNIQKFLAKEYYFYTEN